MGPRPQAAGSPEGAVRPYAPLRASLALQLAAPHTWPAAILPVLFGIALAAVSGATVSVALAMALLCIAVLMQAAANTLNDYFDYLKGADKQENQVDPSDAVLVYHNVSPRSVLFLAVAFLGAALALGLYVVWCAGWVPLAIGCVGAAIILLYSGGRTPLSYLPLGELASGFTMGCLISLASYQALTLRFDLGVLYLSVPFLLGIALIMFTNNTCDIEKDIEAGRRTLPVLLGRRNAIRAYRAALVVWVLAITALTACFFTAGLMVVPFMALVLYPGLKALWKSPFTLQARVQAMSLCLNANIGLGVFYIAAVLASPLLSLVW